MAQADVCYISMNSHPFAVAILVVSVNETHSLGPFRAVCLAKHACAAEWWLYP